ncbi:hypothetical protein [Acidovorax sp. SUPP2825]|uniref:hypothetical protein n=1 Tax=Acidovorax sp. SUPP2825 TaxID=2920879 RepID=UPI0023DE6461|nr:hypothetical protein [Acidovorax sp. SUPP2825]GKS92858.1 hypothetical protein AVAK2825_00005 [Acidovorax sp. SUPP2825]
MRMMQKIAVSCVVVGIFAILAWNHLSFGGGAAPKMQTNNGAKSAPPPFSAGVGENLADHEEVSTRQVEAPAGKVVNSLAKNFHESRNLRKVYLDAMQNFDKGGGLYALNIVMRCAATKRDQARLDWVAKSREQEAAKILREERCSSFIESEISPEHIRAIRQAASQGGDPYIKLIDSTAGKALGNQERAQIVRKIFDSRDPLLLEQFSAALFYENGDGIWLNGKSYKQEGANQIFTTAWLAASCNIMEGNCGGSFDAYAIEGCALTNKCFANRQEFFENDVEERFGRAGVGLYKEIFPIISNAVTNADSSVFEKK